MVTAAEQLPERDAKPRGRRLGPTGRRWNRTAPGSDPATLIGLAAGFALLIGAMVAGGSFGAFFDLPAVLIVLGGTLAVTSISFSLGDLARTRAVIGTTLISARPRPQRTALDLLALAERARQSGPLALEAELPELARDRFLAKAVALAVDATPAEEIERMLRTELQATQTRHRAAAEVLRRAAEVAPAMGLIGTLVGLVQMLGTLDNPAGIGPAMAVALLTTFYGAVLANMILLPLAAKLERNSLGEVLDRNLIIVAVGSIARQESPRRLEVVLNSILPPALRVRYFD